MRASQALAFLAPGLIAFSGVNILVRAFFALGDTRTPMKISMMCLVLNVFLTAGLITHFRQRGLGMANTLTGFVNVVVLGYALPRTMPKLNFDDLRAQAGTLLGSAVVAALAAWGLMLWWENWLGHASLWLKIGAVFVPALVASLLYFGIALWRKMPAATEMMDLVRSRLGERKQTTWTEGDRDRGSMSRM